MRLGIDLGGTKIAAVVLDADGHTRWQTRVATPRGDYDGTIAAIEALVREGEAAVGVACHVGIGIPGSLAPHANTVRNANSIWLNGQPFERDLRRALNREVRLANDANCLAVSEAADGAAAGAAVVFGVILGTGTGGGVVVHGRLLEGLNRIGGEWGHNPLPWPQDDERPGPACYCGQHGCIETWVSGTGLAADHARAGGETIRGEDVVERAAGGDRAATEALARWEHRLARSLASIINVIDPDVIVVGGGLSRIGRLYENVPRLWHSWVFSDRIDTHLVPARHGDASGVRGAAGLWTEYTDSIT